MKLVLQQARHSAMPLIPTRVGMSDVFLKAKHANQDEDPFEPSLCEYGTKAATLY